MSFLLCFCHSFHMTVIPSILLAFLLYYCHSSRIFSFLLNIAIPSKLLPFPIFVIQKSSCTLPYQEGEKIGQQSWPYLRVISRFYHIKMPDEEVFRKKVCKEFSFFLSLFILSVKFCHKTMVSIITTSWEQNRNTSSTTYFYLVCVFNCI